ncbi:hypothetical protein SDRG_09491 [Saprolegnia diclina VS20]|uniref:Uncharacterized protein n=1 Tax=Saprolegnia diclina (strain VS20) TaxID=1156394 RepID=T0QH74_SAPDV|nr:hypothetical protein SDRG_09491 [Saprolegnia diclina VS20]EQC32965.1 hypothetical protein SDRG_09491 [Saprolegnia diclina VS20]|eukprot:XP_008613651.1 hypothetical protein SDRG_09491 [Saprolegnia diclina VS20]
MGKDEVDESVLAANFTHDVQQILSTIKETKGRKFVDLGDDDACPEVGYYGSLGHKLQRLLHEMQAQLSLTLVVELFVSFGDMFFALQEYTVATLLYQRANSLYGTKTAPTLSDQQLYVRATYVSALCAVRQLNQRDPRVKCPSTLRRQCDALGSLQHALAAALALAVHRDVVADKATHATCIGHVLNGTIHIVSVCAPLQTLGFDADVLPYLKYCSLALDSLIPLGTVRFLAWRTYIYIAIATGYNALALKHPSKRDALWKSALAALDLGLKRVHRLRQEEELDLPLPEATDAALKAAERDLQIAKFPILRCTKAPSAPQLLVSVAKADVESAFSDPIARARAMLQILSLSLPSSWVGFGQWIKPTEPPPPVVLAPTDVETMLQGLKGLAVTLALNEHIDLLKLSVRYKHWDTFADVYSSLLPRLSPGVATDEVGLFHAFVSLMQTAPDEMSVTQLNGELLTRLVVVLHAAARNDALCALRHDVLAEMVFALWHSCIVPCLRALDDRLPDTDVPVTVQELTKDVLFALHVVAHAIELDDVVWRAVVALRLGRLLADVGDTRVGIQVLRVGLDGITRARSACVDVQLHDEVASTPDGRHVLHGAAYGASILDAAFLPSTTDGALFQMQRLNRLLASLETDMTLLLYECEYDDLLRACGRKAFAHLEARLVAECNRNDYRRGLLMLQAARRRAKGRDEQESCLADALRCFHALRHDELDVRHAPEPEAPMPTLHMKPSAPRLASRGATFVSLRLAPFAPLKKHVAYFMVFGKATGAGTDVSLNNMAFPGTGAVVDPSQTLVTISGLLPNESYVFAVAAYDSSNAVIEGIGATSRPVVTLHPLLLPLCYGLLAHIAQDLGHLPIAVQAAKAVYAEFVDEAPVRNRWRCSPLFSHALKLERPLDGAPRGAIAEYPMQVLHVFLRCVYILIGPEVGEPATDGRLRSPNGTRVVIDDQLHVLSSINRGMLALEVAALTGHHEYMASVSHRLYRLMVPLLHLPSSGGALFQPLCMLLESLQLVPETHWDDALYATYMCASFELLRIATEKDELQAAHACLKLHDDGLKHLNMHVHAPFRSANAQACGLRDTIFLDSEWMAQLELSATTTISAPDVDKAKGKATPRDTDTKGELPIEEALPGLANVAKATNELRTFFVHHREYLPYVCRVVRLGVDRGDKGLDAILQSAAWSYKLLISFEAKRTLQQLHAAELVPEPPTQAPVPDVLATARADPTATTVETTPHDEPNVLPPDVVDTDVYLWSGQVFFLRGLLHVTSSHADDATLNHLQGPDHDLSWLYLTPLSASLPAAYESPGDRLKHDGVHRLLLEMATATQLFYHGRAWPNLLEAVRAVWNGLWLAWVSPLEFHASGYDWQPLFVCCMRVWDVLELHSFGILHNDVDVLCRSMDAVDDERPVVATSSQLAAAADATPGLDLGWLTKVTLFTLQVLCHGREWQKLVVLGKRAHVLSGGQSAMSELLLPWVVFAQMQRVALQDARVERATSDLAAFVKAFEDSQAKKKKKRSRLVVHEVISDEERAFLDARSVHEATVRDLTSFQTLLKDHGTRLQAWLDLLTRSKSMCLQALDRAQKNVVKRYVLLDESISKREILGAFKACIGLCRQKRATLQLTLALMEQGDYLFAEADVVGAIKAWTDAIDAVFGALDARVHWRTILASTRMDLNGDGAIIALVCTQLVGKLAWALGTDDLHARLECALLGSAVVTTFFTGSLPHPDARTPAAFASYTANDLLSFLPELHLKLAHPAALVLACSTLLETLLAHKQYIEVFPVACALEVLSTRYLRDARGAVQAKRMKAEACIGAGYMSDACRLLSDICHKPHVVFASSKRLGDPDNDAVFRWLCDLSIEKLLSELQARIGSSRVAHLVVLTLLRWMAALASHEGASPQGTALRAALNNSTTALQASVLKSQAPAPTEAPASARKGPEPTEPVVPAVPDTEPLHLCDITKVACECDILLATIALQDGFVEVARNALVRGMKLYSATPKLERDDDRYFDGASSELNVLYWLDCRVLSMRCDIAQGHYDDAIALAEIALDEAATANDRVFALQLRALRIQARLLRGDRTLALADAETWVADNDAALPSLTHAEVCIMLSVHHRTDAMSSSSVDEHVNALRRSVAVLTAAIATTDALLTHQGWMGLAYTPHRLRLLNFYHPSVPMFVVLKAHFVARQLDLYRACPDDVALEHLLPVIMSGLEALMHVCHPPSYLKPLLLYFKGAVLRRLAAPGATDAFLEALTLWIKDGGHPRSHMYDACMELVVVFGSKRSDADTQAAFHYLQLACKLQDQLFGLWNSSQLNATSATGLGTLPTFLQQEILASAKSTSTTNGSAPTMEQLGYLVLPYFVSFSREHDVVFDASLSGQLHRAHVSLHNFLAINHSGYAKLCLSSLPPVPKDDPEIPGGLVCVQWLQTSPTTGDMYYALGTATSAHDSRFADAPLLSRKSHVSWSAVRALKADISRLRHALQDKEDHIEHPQAALDAVLAQMTSLLQPPTRLADDAGSNLGRDDAVLHAITCSLDDVGALERIFCTARGINQPHPAICYFLRHVLAAPTPSDDNIGDAP